MIILTLRTDKPEAEIGLYSGQEQIHYETWQAHRELAETIHKKLSEILNKSSIDKDEINGIICYEGPGSFTGLRIGLTVANTIAYSQSIPIVTKAGPNWQEEGIKDLLAGKNEKIVIPKYGSDAKTTIPRK
jgi:tRNA threonylcarbamoyladenosine biosynthesis protein TsaB